MESILDHIYIKDVTLVEGLTMISPEVGDHKLIKFRIAFVRQKPKMLVQRNWRAYGRATLLEGLLSRDFNT